MITPSSNNFSTHTSTRPSYRGNLKIIMCQTATGNSQQNGGTNNGWEEEARRQTQLYPDLSELLDAIFSSTGPNPAPQTEAGQRQSVWKNIFDLFGSNVSPAEQSNNSNNQQHSPSAPPPDETHNNQQNLRPNQGSQGNTDQCQQRNNSGFENQYHPRNPPHNMPWNRQCSGHCNMPNGMFYGREYFNNRPCFPPFLSAFLLTCVQSFAKMTGLLSMLLFLFCVPHTLLAIGLAIAVLHSITRIPVLQLVIGSLFLSILLYLDSQLLMILCFWAMFKTIVMGKPLVNREFWRRCFQIDSYSN